MSLRSHELAVETTYKQHENGASEAVFNLVPGPGTHYFKFRGSWFQVSLIQTPRCLPRARAKAGTALTYPFRSSVNEMPSSWICTLARHGRL